ncbi:MAG: hypothetical protein UY87_C0034G0009 [Candidatus Peribacteria bacterium GW2011_GWC2_54_8]|nr:MAG: hypothetical protein UY87_C0034G0009 [Candidatus Peribacteria bacterium GW2011_GWC2_54_8]
MITIIHCEINEHDQSMIRVYSLPFYADIPLH